MARIRHGSVTHIARARVGAPVAHARDELRKRLGEAVKLAVRAEEAERIVGRALRHILHVLGGAEVFAKVNGAEAEQRLVHVVSRLSTRERRVRTGRHLVRKQARRHRHDRVHVARLVLRGRHGEGEHRRLELIRIGVVHVEALHQIRLDLRGRRSKELGVATRAVAVGHDVLHDVHVLRLGDDRLEVARVVAFDGLDGRVGLR